MAGSPSIGVTDPQYCQGDAPGPLSPDNFTQPALQPPLHCPRVLAQPAFENADAGGDDSPPPLADQSSEDDEGELKTSLSGSVPTQMTVASGT